MRGDCGMTQISVMYGVQVRSSMEYGLQVSKPLLRIASGISSLIQIHTHKIDCAHTYRMHLAMPDN